MKLNVQRKTASVTKSAPRKVRDAPAVGKLLVAAERMFGEMGIEATSIRQILLAADQANKSAVQHHFGSKEALVQAVFDMRMPTLDAARRKHLDDAERKGPLGAKELLEALLLPVCEEVDSNGQQTCARFLFRLLHRDETHPVVTWSSQSAAAEIDRRLRKVLHHLPQEVFDTRFRMVVGLFLTGIAEQRSLSHIRHGKQLDEALVADLIAMATAAFEAPLADVAANKKRPQKAKPAAKAKTSRTK